MNNKELIHQKTLEKTQELANSVREYLDKFDKIDIGEGGGFIGWLGDTPYLITINLKLNCYKKAMEYERIH